MTCNSCTPFLTAENARLVAKDNSLIYSEICAIQKQLLAAINQNLYNVVISNGTPITTASNIISVDVINGGSNYDVINAEAVIDHPTGVGAILSTTVMSGVISNITVTNGGSGYSPIIAQIDATGFGAGNALLVPQIIDGKVVGASILVPGTGYSVGNTFPVIHPTGFGASVVVNAVSLTGAITSLTTTQGSGYDSIYAQVTINHPSGIMFSGNVQTSGGVVTGVTITNPGLGYTPIKPTINITEGSGAQFDVVVNAGIIENVNVSYGGFGYSSTSVATVVPVTTGSGAVLVLNVNENSYPGIDVTLYHKVFIGQVSNKTISEQLNEIKKYFECLGYTITIKTNPQTMNTILWDISW